MKVRSSGRSCVSYKSDEFATLYGLSDPNIEVIEVGILGHIAKAMVHFDFLTIARKVSGYYLYNSITCCVDRSSSRCGEVNAGMHLLYFINRVYTKAETRSQFGQ